MPSLTRRILLPSIAALASLFATGASAQQTPPLFFQPGNLVVEVEGCGIHGGTCTTVPNGTGTATQNATQGGYGDNQGAPLTLFQYTPNATSSVTYVNSLVLPQTALNANLPVSSEYGSSSEGTLQLSGPGQYLTVMGYGLNANTFNAAYPPGFTADPYGASPSGAMAQSGSLTGQSYTPVARVAALIDPYGNINSATALYNIFNTNNPRSIYTADGYTYAYVSGQGSGCDATGGVFYIPLGAATTNPTAITGLDANGSSSCDLANIAQDTRDVQIYDNTLYISVDTKEGSNFSRSFIGTLGNPPATSLYEQAAGPTQIPEATNTGKSISNAGKITLTAQETNGINSTGLQVNLSPVGYFFASPTVLYIADSGNGKQTSANSSLGDGGLQKWVNVSGTWELEYTMASGLNLVANTNSDGTSGLYGLAGKVVGNNVYLYATNYTLSDLDPTYLYGITDTLTATSNTSSFVKLDTAPPDSNFKGVSFAPTLAAGSATITTVPSGLAVSTFGTGCAAGTYTTPVTLPFTPDSECQLSTTSTQGPAGAQYIFSHWQDGATAITDSVAAPAASAVYTATFTPVDKAITLQFASTQLTYPGATNLTACVAGATSATATGSLTIHDGSTTLTTIGLQGNGCAYWYISPGLTAGTHSLYAVYSGDSHNPAGASAPTNISVSAVPVNLSASCWNPSFSYGANYQCTVNVSSNAGSAQGDITYSYNSGSAISVPLNNGNAQFIIDEPSVGNQTVTIAYPQQGNFAAGNSVTENFTVTGAPVNVQLTPSTWYTTVGNSVTLTAAIYNYTGAGNPTSGSVTFYDGSTLLGTVPVSNGSAAFTAQPSTGTQTFTATYTGGTGYATGSSTATITIAQ